MAFCFYRHPHRPAPALLRDDAWLFCTSRPPSRWCVRKTIHPCLKSAARPHSDTIHSGFVSAARGWRFLFWVDRFSSAETLDRFRFLPETVGGRDSETNSFLALMRKLNVAAARLPLRSAIFSFHVITWGGGFPETISYNLCDRSMSGNGRAVNHSVSGFSPKQQPCPC